VEDDAKFVRETFIKLVAHKFSEQFTETLQAKTHGFSPVSKLKRVEHCKMNEVERGDLSVSILETPGFIFGNAPFYFWKRPSKIEAGDQLEGGKERFHFGNAPK
jgi:hypothetical protein